MKKIKKNFGFTLVEISLIIAIVFLVFAIVLVNSSTIKSRAQRNTTFTEFRKLIPVFESCFLDNKDIICASNANGCDGTSEAKPVANTSICFDSAKWPDITKNGYSYTGFSKFDKKTGIFSFGLIRDVDENNISDNGGVICCSQIGCVEYFNESTDGSICITHAGL